MTRPAVLIVACVTVIAAHLPAQAGRVEHLTRGDTSIVRTTGNGVWGAPRMAVELRRVGGTTTRETTFNRILSLTILPNGAVALYDDKSLDGPIIRLLDADGHFIRNVGRIGSGPGEYRSGMTSPQHIARRQPDDFRSDECAREHLCHRWEIRQGDSHRGRQHGNCRHGPLWSAWRSLRCGVVRGSRSRRARNVRSRTSASFISTQQARSSTRSVRRLSRTVSHQESNQTFLPDGRMVLISSDRAAVLIAPSRSVGHGFIAELAMPRVAYASDERKEIEAGRAMLLNSPGRSGATERSPHIIAAAGSRIQAIDRGHKARRQESYLAAAECCVDQGRGHDESERSDIPVSRPRCLATPFNPMAPSSAKSPSQPACASWRFRETSPGAG